MRTVKEPSTKYALETEGQDCKWTVGLMALLVPDARSPGRTHKAHSLRELVHHES